MTTLAVALLLPELFIKVTILYASCAKCIYALLYLCREITLNGLGLIARTLQLTGRLILQLLLGRHSLRQPCLRARVLDAVLVCTLFLSKSISTTSVDTSVLTVRSWDHSFMSNMILDYIWVTILQSFLSSKALHIKRNTLILKVVLVGVECRLRLTLWPQPPATRPSTRGPAAAAAGLRYPCNDGILSDRSSC